MPCLYHLKQSSFTNISVIKMNTRQKCPDYCLLNDGSDEEAPAEDRVESQSSNFDAALFTDLDDIEGIASASTQPSTEILPSESIS